jgi:hypothetical protein
MNTDFPYDTITFEYNSGPIPPPFCHKYKIVISKKDKLYVSLDLEYFDRDELTEEEIYEEGFTDDDDFRWEGELPSVWGDEIAKKLAYSNWRKNEILRNDGASFRVKSVQAGISELRFPDKPLIFEMLSQEIIQAVFELGKKEAPLEIRFCAKKKNGKSCDLTFTYYFADKRNEVVSGKKRPGLIGWEEGQKMLKYIFGIDYYPENGTEDVPKKEGNYISPGDRLWYELAPFTNAGKRAVERIEKLVKTLKAYC